MKEFYQVPFVLGFWSVIHSNFRVIIRREKP